MADMTTIKDIDGNRIEVTDLQAAIQQCIDCSDSHYKMASGHTVGENHRYMLEQLKKLQNEEQKE